MRRIAIAFVLLAVLLLPPILAVKNETPTLPLADATILVVGNFDPADPFGPSVKQGVAAARQELEKTIPFDVHFVEIGIPSTGPADDAAMRRKILRKIATANVVAIIAATTSQHAPEIERIATTLHIPTFFAVATYSGLLSEKQSWCYRLPAPDNLQADTIVQWVSNTQKAGPTAILYDTGIYGSSLADLVIARCKPLSCLGFRLTPDTDMAGVLGHGQAAHVANWIVAGYSPEAMDFLSKKRALRIPGSVLLSDGCWGPWILGDNLEETALSFPSAPLNPDHIAPHHFRAAGYAPFGHDAVMITIHALEAARESRGDRDSIRRYLTSGVATSRAAEHLMYQYKFSPAGENLLAQFSVVSLDAKASTKK